jgi:hypothetical protein
MDQKSGSGHPVVRVHTAQIASRDIVSEQKSEGELGRAETVPSVIALKKESTDEKNAIAPDSKLELEGQLAAEKAEQKLEHGMDQILGESLGNLREAMEARSDQ